MVAYGASGPQAPSREVDAEGRSILAESVRLAGSTVVRTALTEGESAANLTFTVSLKMRDFAGLQARIAAGEKMSLPEMEARYRPLKSDYDRVAEWLTAEGFGIVVQDSTHTNLVATGSVAGVSRAFMVQMARVAASDGECTAAISAPRLPAALADAVLSVNGLQPQIKPRRMGSAGIRAPGAPRDLVGSYALATPDNIKAAYNVPSNLDGAGQTIAILDGSPVAISDLTSFWTQTHVAQQASNVTIVLTDGSQATDVDDELEAAADVEWAGAMAPGAKIRQYVTGDVLTAFVFVLNDLPANPTMKVLSLSYGYEEYSLTPGLVESLSQTLAQLAAMGVTVFASSGDGGSNSVLGTYGSASTTAPASVDFPASDPDVTGVGGTELDFDSDWNVTSELAWNDLASANSATGGGTSTIFLKPAWQTGGAVLAGQSMRCVPDVAAISVAVAPPPGIPLGDGTSRTGEFNSFTVLGGTTYFFAGTSLATPIWAGFGALINQARSAAGHGAIGALAPNLYSLGGTAAFNDVTSGSNGAYSAGAGYDLCTGLGSPNVTQLVAALTSVVPTPYGFSPTLPIPGPSTLPPQAPVKGGTPVTMGVTGAYSNLGAPTYQWLLNGIPIPDATGPTYSIAAAAGQDRGLYTLQVTNDIGTALVGFGTLDVVAPSVVVTAAAPSSVATGATATMSGTATSSGGPLSYQWSFNGVALPGAVLPSLTVSNIGPAQAGDYTLTVSDSNGKMTVDLGTLSLAGANYLTPYAFTTLPGPDGIAVSIDGSGNLYVCCADSTIRKIGTDGAETLLAGTPGVYGSADGPGATASFSAPGGLAADAGGTVYVADTGNCTIRKITPDGVVSTIAGKAGVRGYADGIGTAALFAYPQGIAVDSNGILYVADTLNGAIRVIAQGGLVRTLAGNPDANTGNADGVGKAARFLYLAGITVDAGGTIYVADSQNDAIRKITQGGQVTTFAGNSGPPNTVLEAVYGSADGTARTALFGMPQGLAVDAAGNLFVSDTNNCTIREISAQGVVSTLGGVPERGGETDGVGSAARFNEPTGLAVDANGVLYIGENGKVRVGRLATSSSPSVLTQPSDQTVALGSTVTFGVVASTTTSYQWYQDGTPIPGAVNATLIVSGTTYDKAGAYTCAVSNSQGSVMSATAHLAVVNTSDPGRLINLSCRAHVGAGTDAVVVGFAVGGPGTTASESVLVRASGPALVPLGVSSVLVDPSLQLVKDNSTLATNSAWAGATSLVDLFSQVGAFPWNDPASADSALAETLTGGTYSAVLSGVKGDTGVALAEIYDGTPPGAYSPATPRLVNLSARTHVGTGADILIAGFVIGGSTSKTVLIRASGPALAAFGIAGTLADPGIRLNSDGGLVASNSGWGADPQIASVATASGAFSWGTASTSDSALLLTLTPGAYTVEVSGASGDTGIALVEVYEVP